jgi:hypothetical protein
MAQVYISSDNHMTLCCGAQAVYKDKNKIAQSIRDNMPGYKTFTEFEYGFKIRNKEKPESWYESNEVVMLPPEDDIPKNPIESFKSSVSSIFGKKK